MSLFATVISVWASDDNQQDKVPAKKENAEAKACCADKKEGCAAKAGETKACCADKKEGCTAKAGETKACCADKKTAPKTDASGCANKAAMDETKSCGKKAN